MPLDVAQVTPEAFDALLLVWKYSKVKPEDNAQDLGDIVLDIQPKEVDLMRARAFHNATRLMANLAITREKAQEYRDKVTDHVMQGV